MKLSFKSVTFILIIALLLAFCVSFGIIMSNGVAFADDTETKLSTVTIGHFSDLHYFPYQRGYTPADYGTDTDKYYDSEFYFSITGDTKLVEESAAVFDATCEEMYLAALDGELPQVFVASGDLSKNGEKDALADLANRLRLIQNDIRQIPGYENFQILCVPGNHDLFNGSGAYYTKDNGKSYKSTALQGTEFALLFSGLGYPNNTIEQLTTVLPESYWSTNYGASTDTAAQRALTAGFVTAGKSTYYRNSIAYKTTPFYGQYVQSNNAAVYDIHYYNADLEYISENNTTMTAEQRRARYAKLEANEEDLKLNALSFYLTDSTNYSYVLFGIDASFRTAAKKKAYTPYIASDPTPVSGNTYYKFEYGKGFTELTLSQAQAIVADGGEVYVDSGLNHETGGKISLDCVDWMESVMNSLPAAADTGDEFTGMITVHQNLLEHWDKEGEILKDFTLYYYEYLVKRFLHMGIRYSFTGHMHANDVAYYTNAEGETFYDLETGSMISYYGPKHYISIERYKTNVSGKDGFAEKFILKNDILETFAYDLNGNGVIDDDEKEINYNDYSNKIIYLQLIDRVVGHFISDKMVDDLLGSVRDLFGPDGPLAGNSIIGSYAELLGKVAMSLIKQIRYDLDYTFDGVKYDNLVDYLYAVVDKVVSVEFGSESVGKMSLKQIAGFIAQAHAAGLEITTAVYNGTGTDYAFSTSSPEYVVNSPTDPVYRARFISAVQDFSSKCLDGSFVEFLVMSLLKPLYINDNGLLKQVLNHTYNLTKDENGNDLSEAEKSQLNDLLALVQDIVIGDDEDIQIEINVEKFGPIGIINGLLPTILSLLDQYLGFALSGTDLYSIVDTFLDSYLVESFYVGIGGIADAILKGFATDDMPDYGDPTDSSVPKMLVTNNNRNGGKYTYISTIRDLEPSSQVNGMLPSIINGHFEDDNTYTITYYTNEEIFTSFALYSEDGTLIEKVEENENFFNPTFMSPNSDQLLAMTCNGTNVSISTVATPIYYPLIDLGLVCITHTPVFKEVNKEEVPITYLDREMYYETNGAEYWNKHTVTISGLQAGTTYKFNIWGTYQPKSGPTDLISFQYRDSNDLLKFTTPDSTATEFTFLAIADIQGMTPYMYAETDKKLNAITDDLAVKGYDFVLNAGDVTDNSKNFVQMQCAFDLTSDFFSNTAMFVTSGNHENGSYMMNRFFDYTLPNVITYPQTGETGLYYSFRYGNSFFLVLDTNDATSSGGLGEKQLAWLTAELQAANNNTAIKHIFVLMHKSMFSCGSHTKDPEILKMKEQLVPLFANNNVDIVFSGHDHTYSITNKIDKDGKVTTGNGVMYITLGTMGTKFYEYKESEDTTPLLNASESIFHTLDTQTFAYVTVSGDSVTINGYTFAEDSHGDLVVVQIKDQLETEIKTNVAIENGSLGKTIYAGFTSHKAIDEYKISVPLGYKVAYYANGQVYSSLNDVKVNGAKTTVVVKAVNTKTDEEIEIDTITLEIKNYSALLAVCIVIPIIVVGAAACAVAIIFIKKKKA